MVEKKQWLLRSAAGGCIALTALFAVLFFLNGITIGGGSPDYSDFAMVTNQMALRFGSHGLAAAIQTLLIFALGASTGLATLPFAEDGKTLLRRSLLHFAITGALVALMFEACCWSISPLFGVGLYALVYLMIWFIRYLGWWLELEQLRQALGLKVPPSPLCWRESLPYVLLLAAFFLLLRPLFSLIDAPDVPVFTGILLPLVGYPLAAAFIGLSAGRRQGLCPLIPPAAFLAFLPNLLYFSPAYSWTQGLVYAILGLTGNAIGAVMRRSKGKET